MIYVEDTQRTSSTTPGAGVTNEKGIHIQTRERANGGVSQVIERVREYPIERERVVRVP